MEGRESLPESYQCTHQRDNDRRVNRKKAQCLPIYLPSTLLSFVLEAEASAFSSNSKHVVSFLFYFIRTQLYAVSSPVSDLPKVTQ